MPIRATKATVLPLVLLNRRDTILCRKLKSDASLRNRSPDGRLSVIITKTVQVRTGAVERQHYRVSTRRMRPLTHCALHNAVWSTGASSRIEHARVLAAGKMNADDVEWRLSSTCEILIPNERRKERRSASVARTPHLDVLFRRTVSTQASALRIQVPFYLLRMRQNTLCFLFERPRVRCRTKITRKSTAYNNE